MDAERERLTALYKGYTNEKLMAMGRDEQNLTDVAQTALAEELTARGLEYGPSSEELESGFAAGIPGIFPSSAAVVEKALEPGGEVDGDETELMSFFDGHELARACESLEAAGVPLEVRQREGNALTGSPSWYEVWVATTHMDRAQGVLREKLGYFPLAEAEGSDSLDDDDGSMSSVASMDTRAEAEQAARMLEHKGFTARVAELKGDAGFNIEVKSSEREQALHALVSDLGLDKTPAAATLPGSSTR